VDRERRSGRVEGVKGWTGRRDGQGLRRDGVERWKGVEGEGVSGEGHWAR
jgi:hypothetical protein